MPSPRTLPSVDQVLRRLKHLNGVPQTLLTNEIRNVLAEQRDALKAGTEVNDAPIEQLVEQRLNRLLEASLRPVINATGVVLHTNLGRAPLSSFKPIPRYSNLEYDLEQGKRGRRDVHTARLLERLLDRPAIVVNNNAAAVYLVLHELAAGYEVLVSRGELIEIGDGFRIPEIMTRAGAILREVGSTNRTRIDDYRQAINERTRLILRVHPSNFRMSGFTSRPEPHELAELAQECRIPLFEDLGSGCLVDLRSHGIDEPLVSDSFAAGIDLVSFSCDKLLGGPQSGIISGDAALVARIRRNPMYRALRVDKLVIECLETTLRRLIQQDWQAIPALRMIFETPEELRERAERVCAGCQYLPVAARMRESESPIGGGSTPDQTLPTWVVELETASADRFARALRNAQIPVISRIEGGKIILDMRTVANEEEESLVAAVQTAATAA